jgi:F-type H+-transporting ATPase subunit b
MPDLVHQIGELFLRAVPVALIILIFYLVLRSLFFRPILTVMAERETRTIGAQKAAEAAQAAATEKVKQYQEALKHAKAKVYQEQEVERKKLLDERAAMLKETRTKAMEEVGMAKGRVAREVAEAAKEIEVNAVEMAREIAGRVLRVPSAPGGPAREAR